LKEIRSEQGLTRSELTQMDPGCYAKERFEGASDSLRIGEDVGGYGGKRKGAWGIHGHSSVHQLGDSKKKELLCQAER